MTDRISDHASKGGAARAKKLSASQRSEIARRAVEARWEKAGKLKKVPSVMCGSADQPLRIGSLEIPCYVLDDERRVLVQRGMLTALDMSQGTAGRGDGDRLARFLATRSISGFVSNELRKVIINPIKFKAGGGNTAYGYEATVLADICDAVLQARCANALNYQQEHIGAQCEILVRAFAKVGIIALVDEATGFQYLRSRTALEQALEDILSVELRRWVKTFPPAYFRELCRLRGIQYRPDMKLPQYFGHLTNDIVYKRLAPCVLEALQQVNPRENGRRPAKHFQHLSEDVGHPKLLLHLGAVTTLMKISSDWDNFKESLDRVAPSYEDAPLLASSQPD